jgi:2-hydroxychromene-2-carboxylate isomerase
VDVFYSFRSPFSYLASGRLYQWAQEEGVDIHVRPVMPIAIRDPEMFRDTNPKLPPYILRDAKRSAEFMGLPYHWPDPDPVDMTFDPFFVAKDQPLIYRLNRLCVEAGRRGASMAFTAEVAALMWSGRVEDWTEGTHLAEAVTRAGLDLADMEAVIARDPANFDAEVTENEAALETAGHWGVPTLVFQGEPFFGQDRIDMVKWRVDTWRAGHE